MLGYRNRKRNFQASAGMAMSGMCSTSVNNLYNDHVDRSPATKMTVIDDVRTIDDVPVIDDVRVTDDDEQYVNWPQPQQQPDDDHYYENWHRQVAALPSISHTTNDNTYIYDDMYEPPRHDDSRTASTSTPIYTRLANTNRESVMPGNDGGSTPTSFKPNYPRVSNTNRESIMPENDAGSCPTSFKPNYPRVTHKNRTSLMPQ